MLLARMAEAVYWAGRYLERAEDTARIVQVHGETHVDIPVGEDVGWAPLIEIAGSMAEYRERISPMVAGSPESEVRRSAETRVVAYVLTDRDNPSSILSSISAARDNLQRARPVVAREVWEICHELWVALSPAATDVAQRDERVVWLRRVIEQVQRINGVMQGTMRRDEALAFFRLGQHLERAEMTCRLLAVRADSAVPGPGSDDYYEVRHMAVLRSLASYQPFRRTTPTRPDAASTLRFLLQDEAFPRAVSACLGEVRDQVKALPHNERILAACIDTAVLVADAPVARPTLTRLRAFLGELRPAIENVGDHIEAAYFAAPAAFASKLDGRADRVVTAPAWSTRSAAVALATGRIGGVAEDRAYRVVHTTTYEYAAPVEQSYNESHLRPRDTEHQMCRAHALDIDPAPTSRFESIDPFGNAMATFVVQGGFERLSVTATSDVVVSPSPRPPTGPPWESVRTLLAIDRQPAARDARRCRAPSRLVPTSIDLAEYAQVSFQPGRSLVESVEDLTGRIFTEFHYEPGFTSISTPLLEVLEQRRGVCQDFAHLMIGCLRSVGLAARYVSGYIETVPAPGQERLVGADASHAWASVYLPGWGWVDVDPTNDQFVAESYITTAWGRDYWDVSPLRGSVEGGGASHGLEVAVDVMRLVTEPVDA